MELRDTFEAVADLYADVRPGYPAALFSDLQALAGLGPSARVLEVGCGAGQATGDLAARAAHVTAVDPGWQLIAHARQRVAVAHVEFVVASFEAWDGPAAAFDLLACAQAWHWIDPAVGFRKAAQVLRPGGRIAIFGHMPLPPPEPFAAAFKAIYDRYLPGAWGQPHPSAWYLPDGPIPRLIDESGLFAPVAHRRYAWSWPLDPETFGRYLRTDSAYSPIPEGPRFALFDELAQAVADQGGVLESPWETHLYIAALR